jgi:small conductance mechanosensitive channel
MNRRASHTGRAQRRKAARPITGRPRRARSARAGGSRRQPPRVGAFERGARARLRRFRQGSVLAVALTAILLMLWGVEDLNGQETPAPPVIERTERPVAMDATAALQEATGTVRDLLLGFYAMLPKIAIAILLVAVAALLAALARRLLQRTLAHWERIEALTALVRIGLFLVAIGAALSILAGDARALLGSVGLVGLALSWALQTPIESFTGWLLNSFRTYYRVGDRIEVGDVFGDVYKIDVLTTTVWEAGGPGKSVVGAQATGAMITFPNWEILRSNIINYSREFPYVWDEITIAVADGSDLPYTIRVLEHLATEIVGRRMDEPAEEYRRLLERARLAFDVDSEPRVFLSLADSWTNCTIRYLVPARERRRWSSRLLLAVSVELSKPEHAGRIRPGYPRTDVRLDREWSPGDGAHR